MTHNMFGWSYPPGCSGPPEHDEGCEVCLKHVDDCECPECPGCKTHGEPECYGKAGHLPDSPLPITCPEGLARSIGVSSEPDKAEKAIEHAIYKYTSCGAWIQFKPDGIKLGSIVEGCDFGTARYDLSYPFAQEDYSARLDAIEKEASEVWDWANETDETGKTQAEHGVDPPDVYADYMHLNPQTI